MENKKQENNRSFMNNVTVILISQVIVKVFGMIYRIVITNIPGFGDKGLGFYNVGFQIYTVLLALSSVGIPNAISKMVSERAVLNDYKGARKIFRTAMILFSAIGLIATAVLFFGSDIFAHYVIKIEGSQYVMRALAPSLFFVCVSSVIRGYFTGLKNMRATSNSQVIEQILKCTLTIVFVYLSVGMAPEMMASWANFATSVATVLSFLYLVFFYYKRKAALDSDVKQSDGETVTASPKRLMLSILALSIPISLGSIITAINRVIDTATVSRGIEVAFHTLIPAHGSVAAIPFPNPLQMNDEIARLSGLLSKSDILYNMPLAVNFAFATVLVPYVASAMKVKDYKEAAAKVNYSLLVSILIILPCAMGLITLAEPIYKIIYFSAAEGFELLQLVSVSLIFAALAQTMTGSLQGIGKVFVPAISLLFGCIAKIILNVLLIRIPQINIYGAAISSIACQFISCAICFVVLKKHCKLKIAPVKYILKPLAAVVVMGIASVLTYKGCAMILGSGFIPNLISTMVAVVLSVVVYFIAVFTLKIMDEDEIKQLPMGNKVYSAVKKMKLYK